MNNVLTALCGAMSFMPPWIMLGVFGAIILLIVVFIVFKGIKRGIKFIILGLILMAAAYLGYLVYQIACWELSEIIAFAIAYGPTVLFVLIVMTATFVNAKRGLRKSLILALHAFCAGALCVAFFFIMVSVKEVDEGTLNFINFLIGGDGALQRALGVPESCSTLKEVLAECVPVLVGADTDAGIILKDNTAYILTLVDMAYRLIFAVISTLFYFFIIFVLYIVYILCYSQRKYKKMRTAEFLNGKTDRSYRKHHLGGGAVGLVRGMAVGLLSLSFIGSAFFAVAGGKGEGKLEDYDFGNDDINYYYQIYRSIESYGSQGIFKILNALSDATDTPYYLFAADLIFSGELNDEEFGVSDNIKFREEIAAFTGFAKDTLDLMMKYGSEELNAIVGGEVTDNAFDTVVEVMTRTGFQEEFNALIDAFDSQTYIINLSMSFINSVVRNVDDISFASSAIGEGERELIKLIFKKGFLTENIPDERDLIATSGKEIAEGEHIRPYLTVNHILNKSDIKTVLNVVLSILAGEETGDTLQLVRRVIPELGKLSILGTERKSELNPVFARMYCLFENLYLTDDGEDGVSYTELYEDGIDWIGEINTLLDVSEDTVTLYENIYDESAEALDIVRNLFDDKNVNYAENMRIYDRLCSFLTDSRVLGKALSTSFVYRTLYSALTGVHEDVYLPRDLNFGNVYDKNGNVVSYGEIYQLFYGVKLLFTGENKDAFDTILNLADNSQIDELLDVLASVIKSTDGRNTLAGYITESQILRSVISVELISASKNGNTFYVPLAALEKDGGEYVNFIIKQELSQLMENMDELVRFVKPFEGDSTEWETSVDGFINDDNFYSLVRTNRIFEGTVAQLLNLKLQDNLLTVPAAIKDDIDGWITIDGKQGELINLIDALRVANFQVSDILNVGSSGDGNGSFEENVLNSITEMSEEELEIFFNSSVLHYTVSDYILYKDSKIDGIVLVVPYISRQVLSGDVIASVIKKNELISVLKEISALNLSEEDGVDIMKLIIKIARNKEIITGSYIISASVVATMVEDEYISQTLLSVPDELLAMGVKAELEYYNSNNKWTEELPALIDALKEILGINEETPDDYEITEEELDGKISELLTTVNDASTVNPSQSKLNVLYTSLVFRNKITVEIDGAISDKDIVENTVINYVKIDGYYRYEELQALCNAANALGIKSFDGLAEFDFESVSDFNEVISGTQTRLDVVYESVLAQGIITKSVKKSIENFNADASATKIYDEHPLSYRRELPVVYNKSEVETLIKLFGSLSADEVNYDEIGEYIYDNDGVTKSYILVASVSKELLKSNKTVIPRTITETADGELYVKPSEIRAFIDAFNAIKRDYGYDDVTDIEWDENTPIKIPQSSVRGTVFGSEILRATITCQLVNLSVKEGQKLFADESNVTRIFDARPAEYDGSKYRAMLNSAQLEALSVALEIISGSEEAEFDIPTITSVQQVIDLNDYLDEIFESDIMRYRICEFLSDKIDIYRQDAYDIITMQTPVSVYSASAAEVRAALQERYGYSFEF